MPDIQKFMVIGNNVVDMTLDQSSHTSEPVIKSERPFGQPTHLMEGFARNNAFVHTHPCDGCGSYAKGPRSTEPFGDEWLVVCPSCSLI